MLAPPPRNFRRKGRKGSQPGSLVRRPQRLGELGRRGKEGCVSRSPSPLSAPAVLASGPGPAAVTARAVRGERGTAPSRLAGRRAARCRLGSSNKLIKIRARCCVCGALGGDAALTAGDSDRFLGNVTQEWNQLFQERCWREGSRGCNLASEKPDSQACLLYQ